MPTYEYRCEKCGHEFEREQRITEDPIKTCPRCKAPRAKRLISATTFVLKGGGWYSDLYASPGAKKDGKDKGDAAGAEASGGAKGDTGPGAKAEPAAPGKSDAGAGAKRDTPSKKKPKKSGAAA